MWILRAVAASVFGGAAYRDMPRVDPSQRTFRSGGVTEDGVERGIGCAVEAAERIASEVRVLIHPRRNQRMRHLEQDRGRAAERDEQLAVESARDGVARKDADVRHTPECERAAFVRFRARRRLIA